MTPSAHQANAIELVQRFPQLRALVIGDVMLDTYLEGSATRLCSEGPVPVVQKTAEQRIPGGAANTAVNLRALNARIMLLGVVGEDITGSLLRSALQSYDVSDRWLVSDESAVTLHKLRIIADGQYVVRYDEGGLSGQAYTHSASCERQLLHYLDLLYPQCDLVVVSDYCYGVLSHAVIERLRLLHAAHPRPWLIDSKALQHFREVPATVVTPNYQEALLLLERLNGGRSSAGSAADSGNLQAVEHVARQLLAALHTESIVITLAEHGAFLLERNGNATHIPVRPVPNAYDVGAGDSFSAALALALAAGGEPAEGVRIGADAASIVVTRPRTAAVLHQELLQRVSLRAFTTEQFSQLQQDEKQGNMKHLLDLLERERKKGRTIVFTNGIFDILHAGHIQFLRRARALGNVLVVGVNSDKSVRQRKGMRSAINNERDRCTLVAALDMVDYVIPFDEATPCDVIRAVRPDVHVKGGDYAKLDLPEEEVVREVGGQLVILPLAGTLTTGDFMEHIISHVSDSPSLRVSDIDHYMAMD